MYHVIKLLNLGVYNVSTAQHSTVGKTYAAVQHGVQQYSVDELLNGKYLCQVSYWFKNRGDVKVDLERLCKADGVEMFSLYVVGFDLIKK